MASLEKRLQEERKCRMLGETQLASERRARANDVIEATKAQQRSVVCSYFLSFVSLLKPSTERLFTCVFVKRFCSK